MRESVALVVVLVAYALAEAAWLFSMRSTYSGWFQAFSRGPLQLRSIPAAALTYVVLLASFYVLVIRSNAPRASSSPSPSPSLAHQVARGALFGLAVYGVYNLTNVSTLPGYPWAMVAVDATWGTVAFGALAALHALLLRWHVYTWCQKMVRTPPVDHIF